MVDEAQGDAGGQPEQIRYDGRVAIVTGAGNGMGRHYALSLAARGAKVVVNDLGLDTSGAPLAASDDSPAQAVVREIVASGGEAVACHESCATRDGGAAIVKAALDAFGRLDILVHNAGFLRNAPFEALDDTQIRSILDVHLMAGFYVGQPAFSAMKKNGFGRILLTSSASAMFGSHWQANYSAAKAGLVGLVNAIAVEGAEFGITANGLLPAGSGRLGTATDLDWPDSFYARLNPDMGMVVPAMTTDFVTPMVLWLVSERCQTTHSVYSATAGRYAKVLIAATNGWLSNYDAAPSPEDIERHIAEIDDPSIIHTPQHVLDEFAPIIELRKRFLEGANT
ncbi:SDR family NAD(P)-dependent oxidoreductase [Novosphingobium taihuense]|uniref:NAD(P)-dependent dehydrogenase (Short-subunit alcohol dehydrogenase family) n=1 Tax=Novosphingobium taihuense TaxID=260085 RepID=A0A7W7ACD7_9SPHN|nr:SDR family NAD(P)-dependent oxidoreductase [Novosphingobium taihuense]MBB4614271.1 NAD(P)-dependent dehydrogenase (short-subunit alcohol dehydrogenase family) [Novosphingobium taihuense]TWH87118.1 NAD(P)-dependent dehydrogenase (short-subunit alcohol dehydrogenase family) [Novosphingobium taihuense]